jgi:hypothetical protein
MASIGGVLGVLCLMLAGAARAGNGEIVCPNADLAGRALQDQSFGATVFCSYGSGLDCIYNASTGDLEVDSDGGNCPATATIFMGAPPGPPTGAPALTRWGLVAAAGALAGIAGLALRRPPR